MNLSSKDIQDWFDKNSGLLATHAGRIALILVLALLLRLMLHRAVRRVVRTAIQGSVPVVLRPLRERARGTAFEPVGLLTERRQARAETLGSVLRSIATFTVGTLAAIMILSELGLDLTPIVASAGIVGVAVGFGAQAIVKDFLTGIFMLVEDQYGVGDFIDAGAASGTVESVTLRTTRLRDLDGTVWHLRNGEILRIGNKSQGWARAIVNVPLPLDTDLPAARALVLQIAQAMTTDPEFEGEVTEEPEVNGIESMTSSGLVLQVVLKTTPLHQWAVERALRERVLAAFQEHGISFGA